MDESVIIIVEDLTEEVSITVEEVGVKGDHGSTEMDDMSNMTTSKTTPIDADNLTIWDSVASVFKKFTIANLKTFLNTLYVRLTTNQTIAGIKTFSSFPVTPISSPTTDYQVANKKYVDDNAGGGGGGSVQSWEWKGLMGAFTDYYYSWNTTRGSGDTSMNTSFIGSNESLMAADYTTGVWGCVDFNQTIVKFRISLGSITGTTPSNFLIKMFKCTYTGTTQNTRVKIVDVVIGSLDVRGQGEVLAAAFANTTLTKGDYVYCYIGSDTSGVGNRLDIQITMETTPTP